MLTNLFKKTKDIHLERSYPAPVERVWQAVTDAEVLRQWWGPEKTTVPECRIDPRVDGEIYVVTEAGEGMGKYRGTRWPMSGTITLLEAPHRLVYEARSWTEGDEEGTTIRHVNDLTLTEEGGTTTLALHIAISEIGPKAKMAGFGMKMGYKDQLTSLGKLLAASP